MHQSVLRVACAFVLLPSLIGASIPAPPATPVKPVTDTYFGTAVVDRYRWMENLSDPAVQTWFRAQADRTNAVLATLDPARTQLRARIAELSKSSERVEYLDREGDSYFYLKRPASAENFRLYVRPIAGGDERMLLNPETMGDASSHYAIAAFAASPDGRYVAVSTYAGGTEVGSIQVLETATGKVLGDSIDRILYGGINWRDGTSFYYTRLQAMLPGMSDNEREEKRRTYLHVLGQSADKDAAIFGYGLSPSVTFAVNDGPYVGVTPASPWIVGIIQHGVSNEQTVYVAPLAAATGPNVPWRKIADVDDKVTNVEQIGSRVYLLEHKSSPRFGIDVLDLAHPELGLRPFIAPSDVVIRSFGLARDGLYTLDLDGGVYGVRRKAYAGGNAEPVALPFKGTVGELDSDPRYAGAQFQMEGWTNPLGWYHASGDAADAVADLGIVAKPSVDFSNYVAEEVKAKSYDGTLVPLSIVHKKGISLDGTHPTLLDGYGAYGIVEDPGFTPRLLALLERGGVYAVAHVRGGGEYGDDWHLAGQKANKKNTWLDFIACAHYLIDNKYTSSAHIAAEGGSAGGITVGRAITTEPGLFAVALIQVGWEDVVRIDTERNGPANIPEFGSATTPDGFHDLYEMDSYLHVQDGTNYPAVMLLTGINDRRVAPWHPAKMTARLQAASSSGKPVLLRVDYDLGHSQGATKTQINDMLGDEWAFFLWQTGDPQFQPGAQHAAR